MDNVIEIAKRLDTKHNVCIRIIDEATSEVVQEHVGHNAATNSLLTGIGHYLAGEGILGQGEILRSWIPQYISLGTMGLFSQEEDDEGLPAGIGPYDGDEIERFKAYMAQCPGFGSDGYDTALMNNREHAGLGPVFDSVAVDCELISASFPRSSITFRDVVPEYLAEHSETIDVVFSAMVSTGALSQFRGDNDYVFITEVGLWSRPDWVSGGDNGLLAGYRIVPPNSSNWDMTVDENRHILKENILKIGKGQVAQVIWKVQLGALSQFA